MPFTYIELYRVIFQEHLPQNGQLKSHIDNENKQPNQIPEVTHKPHNICIIHGFASRSCINWILNPYTVRIIPRIRNAMI